MASKREIKRLKHMVEKNKDALHEFMEMIKELPFAIQLWLCDVKLRDDRYKWHDIEEDPEDVPKEEERVIVQYRSGFVECGCMIGNSWCCDLDEYSTGRDVITAWREIEKYEKRKAD